MISGMIRNLLRPQHNAVPIAGHVGIHFGQHLRAERERRRRRRRYLARLQQANHAVLNHFGVRSQALERTFLQPKQHRVGDVAHAGLQGQQIRRHATLLHFPGQEFQDVPGNPLRRLIRRLERAVAVGRIRQHDGDDLLGSDFQIRSTDALAGAHQRNWPAIGRRLADRSRCHACLRVPVGCHEFTSRMTRSA